jgi:hypothetical protein
MTVPSLGKRRTIIGQFPIAFPRRMAFTDPMPKWFVILLALGLLVAAFTNCLATSSDDSKKLQTIAISIRGAVRKPGNYLLPRGADITSALEAAGGLVDSSASNRLLITRSAGGKTKKISIRLQPSAGGASSDFILLDDDSIFVAKPR